MIVDQGKDQPRFVLIQIDDVTARKDAERELQHHAAHDPLTGLPNRRLLQHRFTAALQRCRQTGRRGVLLFCDLNHFKQVNDKYGHEAGDRALREIAERLLTQVRHGDTVARLGGDEFAILAEDIERRRPRRPDAPDRRVHQPPAGTASTSRSPPASAPPSSAPTPPTSTNSSAPPTTPCTKPNATARTPESWSAAPDPLL